MGDVVTTTKICLATGCVCIGREILAPSLASIIEVGSSDGLRKVTLFLVKLIKAHRPGRVADIIDAFTPFHVVRRSFAPDGEAHVLVAIDDRVVTRRTSGTLRDFYYECSGGSPRRGRGLDTLCAVLDAVAGVACVLATMHRSGTYHCNVQEDNILFHRRGSRATAQFVLADFDHVRSVYRSHMFAPSLWPSIGTAGYRSPFVYQHVNGGREMFLGEHIVPRTVVDSPDRLWDDYLRASTRTVIRAQLAKNDIYGVGVVLSRIVDSEVARLARACLAGSAGSEGIWTAHELVLRCRELLARKLLEPASGSLVLDVHMPTQSSRYLKQVSTGLV